MTEEDILQWLEVDEVNPRYNNTMTNNEKIDEAINLKNQDRSDIKRGDTANLK